MSVKRKTIKNINTILFDVDGTLLDTTEFIYRSYEHTFRTSGIAQKPREEIANHIGKTLKECYQNLAPTFPLESLCKIHQAFQLQNLKLVIPFAKVKTTLQILKRNHIKIGVVTTRSNLTSIKTLKLSGIYNYLDVIVSGDDVKHQKPHPESLLKALEILKSEKKYTLMVGDTEIDILAGKNTGVLTVGATYGFHKKRIHKTHPDFIINDISEILELINAS